MYTTFSFGNFFKNTVNKVGDAFKNVGNKIKEKTVEWTKDGINESKQALHKLEQLILQRFKILSLEIKKLTDLIHLQKNIDKLMEQEKKLNQEILDYQQKLQNLKNIPLIISKQNSKDKTFKNMLDNLGQKIEKDISHKDIDKQIQNFHQDLQQVPKKQFEKQQSLSENVEKLKNNLNQLDQEKQKNNQKLNDIKQEYQQTTKKVNNLKQKLENYKKNPSLELEKAQQQQLQQQYDSTKQQKSILEKKINNYQQNHDYIMNQYKQNNLNLLENAENLKNEFYQMKNTKIKQVKKTQLDLGNYQPSNNISQEYKKHLKNIAKFYTETE